MQRSISIFLLVIIIFSSVFPIYATAENDPPSISSESAILIDYETGDVLFEKNSNKPMYPASTTKIMTAILTLENTNLNETVIIDKETPFTEGSRIYVIEGEEFTVDQLLHALLIDSANDAAVALAKHISGSIEEFAKLMNKRAKELGAKNTHFTNPHGLPDENHTTTAYDLAMIAKYAMTIPQFREIVKTVRYQIPPTNKQPETRYLQNTNRLLWGTGSSNRIEYNGKWVDIKYDIIDGIKTGYTTQAQQCLVSSGVKDGNRLISVVLKAVRTNVYVDTRKLIDYGFDNFDFIEITSAGEVVTTIDVQNAVQEKLDLVTQKSITKAVLKSDLLKDIDLEINLNDSIEAPISKGEVLGKVTYSIDGKILGESNLLAKESIDEKMISKVIKRATDPRNINLLKLLGILFVLYLIWRTIVTIFRLRKRRRYF